MTDAELRAWAEKEVRDLWGDQLPPERFENLVDLIVRIVRAAERRERIDDRG